MLHSRAVLSPKRHLQSVVHSGVSSILANNASRSILSLEEVQILRSKDAAVSPDTHHQPDYQSSIALRLAKTLRKKPQILANEILDSLPSSATNIISDAFVSGKGFMNFRLQEEFIGKCAMDNALEGVEPVSVQQLDDKQRIIIDFGSPNMGKELHVGHLRSSVIGDTLARMLEFQGHEVTRVSHVGDTGSAIATLLAHMEQSMTEERNMQCPLLPHELSRLYEEGKYRLASKEDSFQARVNQIVMELQNPNGASAEVQSLWEWVCESSRLGFNGIFDRLNVKVEERAESSYRYGLEDVVNLFQERGLAKVSEGAVCIFVDGEDKSPMIIKKKDGGFLYATTDLVAFKSRIEAKYDRLIYVTDKSQSLHFQHLFQAAKDIGWYDPTQVKVDHVAFGLVVGEDGKKLSSRTGGVVSLRELLDEAVEKAASVVSTHVDHVEQKDQSDRIGNAAVRYFELSNHHKRTYQFSFDKVLNRKGNTSVYLMYASARLQSILSKYNESPRGLDKPCMSWVEFFNNHEGGFDTAEWEESERKLALAICQFTEELHAAGDTLCPHVLCEYVHNLASTFHAFYEGCRVLNHPREQDRLKLCGATHNVLMACFDLLGVDPVDRL